MKRSQWKRKDTRGAKRPLGKESTAKLKKELDSVFSLYIRAKYPKVCYTCGKVGTTLQCGHFIPRQYLATRWEEDNCRPCCIGCNIFGYGQLLDFEEHLKKDLGEERIEEMKRSRHQILKLSTGWYLEKIAYYKKLI